MVTSFKGTYASVPWFPGLLYSVSLTPWQTTVNLCLRWGLLDTHRQAWLSVLWDHRSFLLCPDVHKALSVPSKSLFPSPVEVL